MCVLCIVNKYCFVLEHFNVYNERPVYDFFVGEGSSEFERYTKGKEI
jgi:hypothetical protein